MKIAHLAMTAALAAGIVTTTTSQARAVGCVSGAAAGAVAGHYAGHHAVVGAIAGCVAGHEIAKHREEQSRQDMEMQQHSDDGYQAEHRSM